MKIGMVINDLETENPLYTTVRIAHTAIARGHEVWFIGVADFIYDADGSIHARASRAADSDYESCKEYFAAVRGEDGVTERITVDDLDVLMLRNDPADDAVDRPWAQTAGILFGQLAAARGTIVLNDPDNLADAINKTYFQHFPELARPATCISRHADEIIAFIEAHDGKGVIKPLQGSGGHGVFIVKGDSKENLNQMIEAVTRDGYAICQEYLPAAADGDVRLFVMNGRALERDGQYAIFRRRGGEGDARSNVSAGGTAEAAEITDEALRLVEIVRPKLVRDGMHFVGLDIVGDKLMEINVFSPGGLGMLREVSGIDFTESVIDDLERKVEYKSYYGAGISNTEIATL